MKWMLKILKKKKNNSYMQVKNEANCDKKKERR